MTSDDRPFHPIANKFPLLSEAKLQALADDIKENGLKHDIVMLRGKVLDGRNRWLACDMAGVKRRVVQYSGETSDEALEAFVSSCNDQRRHEQEQTIEERLAERRKKVIELREQGKSIREIADEVKAPKSTVAEDITQLSGSGQLKEPETIQGRDNKTRPAKDKSLWCSRCVNIGEQTRDCKSCKSKREEAEAEKKAKKKEKQSSKPEKPPEREEEKPSEPPKPPLDPFGIPLSPSMALVFAPHLEAIRQEALTLCRKLGKLINEYASSAAGDYIARELRRSGKDEEHIHYRDNGLIDLIAKLEQLHPYCSVCPICEFDGKKQSACPLCNGCGWTPWKPFKSKHILPEHLDALEAMKGGNE